MYLWYLFVAPLAGDTLLTLSVKVIFGRMALGADRGNPRMSAPVPCAATLNEDPSSWCSLGSDVGGQESTPQESGKHLFMPADRVAG